MNSLKVTQLPANSTAWPLRIHSSFILLAYTIYARITSHAPSCISIDQAIISFSPLIIHSPLPQKIQ